MKIGYVVSRYPAISHTFISREVNALRQRGMQIQPFTIRRARKDDLLARFDKEENARTIALLPPNVFLWVSAHLRAILRHPLAYMRTLLTAWAMHSGGVKSRLWQLFYFAEAIVLWRLCRKRNINHLHAHFANVASNVSLLATRFGRSAGEHRTWSFTMHGPTEFYDVPRHQLTRKLRCADFVVCISDFCRGQLMGLVEPEHWHKLHVIHCGIPGETFVPAETPVSHGDSRPVEILCVGRLVAVKGQLLLLEAVRELVRRERSVHLTLVGDGPERPRLERFITEAQLLSHVTMAGAVGQDKTADYYRQADIFCLPSFAEGVPVVLMEAMAVGLPVVTTRIMGIPELVEQGKNGLLTNPGRADQLAEALDALVGSGALRKEMGRQNRAKILAEFEVNRSAEQLEQLFYRSASLESFKTRHSPGKSSSLPMMVERIQT